MKELKQIVDTELTLPALYDLAQLERRCTMSEDEFFAEGKVTGLAHPDDFYIYIDRGSKVLGVAHLDFVASNVGFVSVEWVKNGITQTVIWNGALDDRLGVFILLDVLPTMGIECDVLLTTGEEWGRSTAEFFDPPKDYNWMFQFDRNGIDVVMYDYDTPELREMVKSVGLKAGMGSFSDIAELEHLGVKGLNFGTGYYKEHTADHHAVLNDTEGMCWLFREFYLKYKDIKLDHEPNLYKAGSYRTMDDAYSRNYDYAYQGYSDRHLTKIDWGGQEVIVDMNVYERVLDALIDEGVPVMEADELAMKEASEIWDSDTIHRQSKYRDIGIECSTCHALVDYDEVWEGRCIYCRTIMEDYKTNGRRLHEYTEDEWEELEGGR